MHEKQIVINSSFKNMYPDVPNYSLVGLCVIERLPVSKPQLLFIKSPKGISMGVERP